MRLIARGREIAFPCAPVIMGIVNLSDDSFSGDGCSDTSSALRFAEKQISDGAAIIDIGAESARTNRGPVSETEEIGRLSPFIEYWYAGGLSGRAWLSVNTWRPNVARASLALGGEILNDIGGLQSSENARICAEAGAALVIMHTVGRPKVPHTHVTYTDVMDAIERFFDEKIALAATAGLARDAIILDPGIDFAKQRADNLAIYRDLARTHRFQRPILLPVSRKTVIGEVLNLDHPAARDAGTVACVVQGIERGAQIFRVHNVRAAAQAARIIHAIQESGAL